MKLLQLFRKEADSSGTPLIVMTILSGLANAGILAVINSAADQALDSGAASFRMLAIFLLAICVFFISKKYALLETAVLVQKVIENIRARIINKIRAADLRTIETLGESEIYNRLTQDAQTISSGAPMIVNALQSAVMLFFCVLYLIALSKLAFLITVGMIVAAIFVYFSNQREVTRNIALATDQETEFFSSLNNVLQGSKELKVNQSRNDDLYNNYVLRILSKTKDLKIVSEKLLLSNFMFTQAFYYVLLAVIVFLLPKLGHISGDVITKTTAAILFIVGPLEMLVAAIPSLARTNVSIDNIEDLERKLDKYTRRDAPVEQHVTERLARFETIDLCNLVFSYGHQKGRDTFTLGPVDLTIHAGEVLFIIGGNGSGKSTVMKLLTGLYYPDSGSVLVDGEPIDENNYQSYRELFSIIFTDFHLFDRFYGLQDVEPQLIHNFIKEMQLSGVVGYKSGRFTNLDLSTGQRKRLAMINSFLEDKPVCIFDEWAADQDPGFRRHFYEHMLPKLKREGKTIVAVTHDDHYFHCADRVLKMDMGKFVLYQPEQAEVPLTRHKVKSRRMIPIVRSMTRKKVAP
ncbi:Cyclic peptide export ABC transporter [Sulfidibacter corallicola]|uniref:Cyclic peptide export ABC transporter n=1 Tax=Sulfidibacter corallicola TaxID=2818388 RepID=A0A8A4TJD1_SULCO|nr:cyclic peptide export ABC transporter [Sulfidibacter corallicola]QTD49262.1 cyclic peptide export ABC transporter [Sulfidibacter corallicola]